MKVYAFLPAKGNSERVLNKNQQILAGEKLYIHGLKKLINCKKINKVILDTDSQEMHNESSFINCEHMLRKKEYANNKTDGHKLFLNELNNFNDADIYVQYLCTSPFIKSETIDKCIDYLINNKEYDSVIFMKREKNYYWKNGFPCYDKDNIPNSKDLEYTISESMGLYVIRGEAARKYQRRYGVNPAFIYGKPIEYIDINTEEDLEFANIVAEGIKSKEVYKFNLLKHFISSALLSDLLDDLEVETGISYGGVISGLKSNIKDCNLFGRAKTLSLRPLKNKEDFHGIYNALNSYNYITQNDIIIVQNNTPNFAYFGDLNARIAIQAGASGAIINSVTRDIARTRALNFPVFSLGTNAQDVRRRATVEKINSLITINGIQIEPNDIIFADSDAIIVLKQKYSDMIIDLLMEKLNIENNISNDIVNGKSIEEIINRNGAF